MGKHNFDNLKEPGRVASPLDGIVSLKITIKQARTLSLACETMARLYMGQMDVLANVRLDKMLPYDNVQKIKELVFSELNHPGSYYGIRSDKLPEEASELWDLYQVLRYFLAWDAVEEYKKDRDFVKHWRVDFDEPMRTSRQPLPVVERS